MPAQLCFIRKTTLAPDEYQADFTITDNGILEALTSDEALAVTGLMPAIYFRLKRAPRDWWEREGVLHVRGGALEGEMTTAWEQMRRLSGVSNSTLSKALKWLHERGVIGYDARMNGIGIRIFFNRAATSIRQRSEQKNLRLVPAPVLQAPAPIDGAGFKEHDSKNELDIYTDASAKTGKGEIPEQCQLNPSLQPEAQASLANALQVSSTQPKNADARLPASLLRQAISELKPEITAVLRRENENTREWFLKYALPKAVRVAQRETYDLLRAHRLIPPTKQYAGNVARHDGTPPQAREGKRLTSFLAEAGAEFHKLAGQAAASGKAALQLAYQNTDRALNELQESLLSDQPPTTEEIEQRLAALEETLAKTLWEATDPTERETLEAAAQSELRSYRARMEPSVFNDTVQRRVMAKLRERHETPRVSLFYL